MFRLSRSERFLCARREKEYAVTNKLAKDPGTLPAADDLQRERLAESIAFLLLASHRRNAIASEQSRDEPEKPLAT